MKTLYVCDKCGAKFEDYDQCHACEDNHIGIGSDFDPESKESQTWKSGDVLPRTFTASSAQIWKYNEDGTSSTEYVFGVYKFERILNPEEAKAMLAKRELREQKQKEYWENWERSRKTSSETPSEAVNEAVDSSEEESA